MAGEVQKFLDNLTGLPTLWTCIGNKFVAKEEGKGLSSEDFTSALKTKLEGIETGAEVNQNAFSSITVGESTISASSATDSFELAAGSNVSLTVSGDAVTIAATDTTYSTATPSISGVGGTDGLMSAADKEKLNGIAEGAEANQNAFGTVTVGEGASAVDVAADAESDALTLIAGSNVTLTGDAANDTITIAATDTTYGTATPSTSGVGGTDGLMSAADKEKLNGIEAGAEVNDIDTIKVNGTALTPSSKAVDITVPTAVSDLTNDSNFQTDTDVATAIAAAVASAYIFKGTVATESDLPDGTTGHERAVGDVYNITAASSYGPAGMNVAWDGSAWDALGSSISIDAMTAAEVQAICV